jgi:phospholipase C
MPAAGAAFVASKLDAIAANPDVWAKTVFVLNYDENDGIFDHVVPPTPRPGTAGEFVDGLPIGASSATSSRRRTQTRGDPCRSRRRRTRRPPR